MHNLPTGTVTFLFTDIEGSTKLWGQYPEAMKVSLARHDAILRSAIEAQGGYVFKTVGDAFCAAFEIAPDALSAALDAQRALYVESWGETGPLRVRMALHTGAAEERDGDYFGPPLNRVARLLSAGHGGQVLLSLATKELVRDDLPEGVSLQDLGHHRLKDLIRREHVFQLVAPDLNADFPALKSLDTYPNNLPIQLTSFIGREAEMTDVKRLLDTTRLLTITGVGGTGKTRLSLQVGADVLDAFADGVWFVEFAPVTNPDLAPLTVMSILGVAEKPGRPPFDVLTENLRDKDLLLILDNCEHLTEACAHLADALLRTCPKLRILATSRETFRIAGEQTFPLSPLSLPDKEHHEPLEILTQYEAMQLFIDRVVAVLPAFTATNRNAPAIAQICYQLDGLPLAIELAAVRVRVLSLEQIATRLNDRFRLLTGGSRTAANRQQTMRAAIDWSYDPLSEGESALFRRLSVFSGGWTLEATEAACSDEGIEVYEVLDLLTNLVDKSLVQVVEPEEKSEARRYRLLETVRQYAHDKLKAAGEEKQARDRHIGFFLELAERTETETETAGADEKEWLRKQLKVELDNLRVGLGWGLEEQGNREAGARLAGALWRCFRGWGYVSEGLAWLEKAREASGGAPADVRANVMHGAGDLAFCQGDFAVGGPRIEQSMEIYRELGNQKGIADTTISLGWLAFNQDSLGSARAHFEESLALYRELEDKPGIIRALSSLADAAVMQGALAYARSTGEELLSMSREMEHKDVNLTALELLGRVALEQDDFAEANRHFEELLKIQREQGNKARIASALGHLAEVSWVQGDCARAHELYAESLVLSRSLGDEVRISWTLQDIGRLAIAQGDYAKARELYTESLEIDRETDRTWGMAWSHLWLGEVAFVEGDYESARTQFEESLAITRKMGTKWGIAWGHLGLGGVAAAQGDYGLARKLHQECLALLRELDSKVDIAGQLEELGHVVLEQGDYAEARSLFDESLALFRELGHKPGIARSHGKLGAVALRRGDDAKARELCEESLKLCRKIGGKWGLADALGNLGVVVQQQGDYALAIDLYRESLALRAEMGDRRTGERPRGVGWLFGLALRTGTEDKRGIAECQEKLAKEVRDHSGSRTR